MAKKNGKVNKTAKRQRGLEKQLKNQKKGENKMQKLYAKIGGDEEDNVDINQMLAELAKKQEEHKKVSIDLCDRPSKRQNATLVANPSNKKEIMLFGGEILTKDGASQFYNDLYIYNTHTDQWRKVNSANSPLPRSSHAMCAHPSGVIVMHGGEFSSPRQTSFHHYGDTWILDSDTKEWTKIESKANIANPQSRSGHRMAVWKNYVLMFGGFRDLSHSTSYLNDLWAFDISDYKWHKIEIPGNLAVPDARSGHSLLPIEEGCLLYGGYTKVKAGKGQQKGKVLQDYWILHMKSDLQNVRWERRKKGAFAPSPRIGCQLVPHRIGSGRGLLFGGVYDTEETEESLTSTFFNTLYSYQAKTNRWHCLKVRPARKVAHHQVRQTASVNTDMDLEQNLNQILKKLNIDIEDMRTDEGSNDEIENAEEENASSNQYPVVNSPPHPRFNATLCVSGDILYIYGGSWENNDHEYSFDSFYAIDIAKLDGFKVFWEDLGLDEHDSESDISDDEHDSNDSDDGDENEQMSYQALVEESPSLAEDVEDIEDVDENDPRPWLPIPKPFETVGQFYTRNINTFVEHALKDVPDARGKELRTHAFELSRSRWWELREKIQTLEDQADNIGVTEVVERSRTSRR